MRVLDVSDSTSTADIEAVADDPILGQVNVNAVPSVRTLEHLNGLLFSKRPDVVLRSFSLRDDFTTLEFLNYLPFVRRFHCEVYLLENIDALRQHPGLLDLSFGATKTKRFSLSFLERHPDLVQLHLEGHKKDIDSIANLRCLRRLALRSITVPSLDFLEPIPGLRAFELLLGGTKNLSVLARLSALAYLGLWQVRRLVDLTAVAEAAALRHLFLDSLRNVEDLDFLTGMSTVHGVVLYCMKGLQRIGALTQLQNLEQLAFVDTRPPRDECLLLKQCKALKQLGIPPNWGEEVVNDIESALPHCDFDTWTPIQDPYELRREDFMDSGP